MSRSMPTPGLLPSTQEQPVRIQVSGAERTSSEGQPVEEEEYSGLWDTVDESLREAALKQLLDPYSATPLITTHFVQIWPWKGKMSTEDFTMYTRISWCCLV